MTADSKPPRRAAGILLRRRGEPRTVYLVRRRDELAFFGGYWAFPGGVLDAADADVEVGPAAAEAADAPWLAAAARELFEETGVLCCHGAANVDDATRLGLRRSLLEASQSFSDALRVHGLRIDAGLFRTLCRMTTPIFSPVRYETVFFLVDVDPSIEPQVDASELSAGEFMAASRALERWRAGEFLIVPPAVILLELLAKASPDGDPTADFLHAAADLTRSYARGKIHQVLFTPGVRKLSLLTETLPPANHTNAYLVGEQTMVLLDPGATRPDEQEKLFEALDEAFSAGGRLAAVILTHAHRDHVGAVGAVVARYGVPVWAHAETARAVADRIQVDRLLEDGEIIPLGSAPDGTPGWNLEVLHTPGHARGHLAFRESRYGAILAGDMISTLSTIVIAPPDGHLGTYLRSLARLRALPGGTIYPAHGPAKRDSHAVIDGYLRHRAERERKVVAALATEPQSLDEILPRAYDDVAPEARALARLSLEAGLIKLCEDGIATATDGGYRLR